MNLFDEPIAEAAQKPKSKKPKNWMAQGRSDIFQTPAYALDYLVPYLRMPGTPRYGKPAGDLVVWEPACGKGNLVRGLNERGFCTYGTDIQDGMNFLDIRAPHFDLIVTNPPFTLNDQFLARCYEIGKPFALLMPLTALEGQKRMTLYRQHGVEVLVPPKRINFETPSGKGSGSWFATAWFTHGLGIGRGLTFVEKS